MEQLHRPPPVQSGGEIPPRPKALGGLLLVIGLLIMAAGIVMIGNSLVPDPIALLESTVSDSEAGAAGEQTGETLPLPPAVPAPAEAGAEPVEPQAPDPTGIRIPAIAVDADMDALGLRADGSIEVPTDFARTGWWADGPEPGETGPAVVLGHVDSRSGPAVFYALTDLQPGDQVIIDRVDGTSVAYQVDRIEQHPKDQFPTEAVYGDTADPQLRLVTCGGEFDSSVRSYRDNIVVFASLVV